MTEQRHTFKRLPTIGSTPIFTFLLCLLFGTANQRLVKNAVSILETAIFGRYMTAALT
jgi:hypothetical protein